MLATYSKMLNAAAAGALILSGPLTAQATSFPAQTSATSEYFVSPTGKASNSGTETSPWPSVEAALERVGGGQTITLLPGIYTNSIVVDVNDASRTGRPTIIRSQRKWKAVILRSPAHGVYTADGVTNVVIDGLQVAQSSIDGVKVGSGVTVRNCWIHHSGRQGVSAHQTRGTILEYNLIERNGTDPAFDHGIYLSGTNDTIRGNVIRWNRTYGCQIYSDPPASSAECQFYNNLVYGNKNALTVWSPAGQTNYVFNNTLVSTNYVLIADYGFLQVANNILAGGKWQRAIWAEDGARVSADYNLTTVPNRFRGVHDVLTPDPGFVDASSGLFFLRPGSAARGRACPWVQPPVDFFGRVQSKMTDLGAFQFGTAESLAVKVVDPAWPEYWASGR